MAELILLAVITALGAAKYNESRQTEAFAPEFDPQTNWDTVALPTIEPLRDQPHSVVWNDVNQGDPVPQPNRMIDLNRPLIWVAKAAVEQEPPHVQRDPLYPDDLRAYDHSRSRAQKELKDSSRRNYEYGSYHIPYLAENKTRQETAQSEMLAGRIYNQYTTGGTEKNGPLPNLKEPTFSVVRRRADHIDGDRSRYQVWSKRQHEELVDNIHQEATPNMPAINQPTEWVLPTKVRSKPKYLNVAKNQHGWNNLQARDNRGDIADIDTMHKKRLILFTDQGYPSSQVTHYSGHENALKYPETPRRRDIHPEVSMSGVFQGGTGRTFNDQNSGQDNKGNYAKTRPILVDPLYDIPHIIGETVEHHDTTPWLSYDPTNDHIMQPRTYDMWHGKGEPTWQNDNAHAIHVPLLR